MYADNRRVGHLYGWVVRGGQSVHDPAPDAIPAAEAVVAVVYGPNLSGRSRHGAPDRKIQKMPSRTRRSFTRGTPSGLSAASA
jgi:hypothetical protein